MIQKKTNTKINEPFLGFIIGIVLFFFVAALFMGCGQPDSSPKPIDWREYNDSTLKAISDSLDSLPGPEVNIAIQMNLLR